VPRQNIPAQHEENDAHGVCAGLQTQCSPLQVLLQQSSSFVQAPVSSMQTQLPAQVPAQHESVLSWQLAPSPRQVEQRLLLLQKRPGQQSAGTPQGPSDSLQVAVVDRQVSFSQ